MGFGFGTAVEVAIVSIPVCYIYLKNTAGFWNCGETVFEAVVLKLWFGRCRSETVLDNVFYCTFGYIALCICSTLSHFAYIMICVALFKYVNVGHIDIPTQFGQPTLLRRGQGPAWWQHGIMQFHSY